MARRPGFQMGQDLKENGFASPNRPPGANPKIRIRMRPNSYVLTNCFRRSTRRVRSCFNVVNNRIVEELYSRHRVIL
nr:hypothetical protein Q903MT_gene5894 [Picea sitchensis]